MCDIISNYLTAVNKSRAIENSFAMNKDGPHVFETCTLTITNHDVPAHFNSVFFGSVVQWFRLG